MITFFLATGTLTDLLERNQISPLVAIVLCLCFIIGIWVIIYALVLFVQSQIKTWKAKQLSEKEEPIEITFRTRDVDRDVEVDVEPVTVEPIRRAEPITMAIEDEVVSEETTESQIEMVKRTFPMALRSVANFKHPEECEDTAYADEENCYAVILDGVGSSDTLFEGEAGGKTASSKALEIFQSALPIRADSVHAILEKFKTIMEWANKFLADLYESRAEFVKPTNGRFKTIGSIATTGIITQLFSYLTVEDGEEVTMVCIGHVGDSRAHIWNPETGFEICTIDHAAAFMGLPEGLRKENMIRLAMGENLGPHFNVIYQAIGSGSPIEVDLILRRIYPGERILLTSDGLHENLFLPELNELMHSSSDIEVVAQAMIQAAYERSKSGGKADDISLIIIDYPIDEDDREETVTDDDDEEEETLEEAKAETEVATAAEQESALEILRRSGRLLGLKLIALGKDLFDALYRYHVAVNNFAQPLVDWFWNKYRSADRKGKRIYHSLGAALGFSMIALFIYSIWGLFLPEATSKVLEQKGPLGITRSFMTAEQMESRKDRYFNYHGEFVLFSRVSAQQVPGRLNQYRKMIVEAAKQRGVDPYWLMGIAFVESEFRPEAYNDDSKASGMFQILPPTGRSDALKVSDGDFRIIKGNSDFRQDARSSMITSAELFKQSFARWGDEALAAWEHHAGANKDGVMTKALTLYLDETQPDWRKKFDNSLSKAVRGHRITYWDLFFRTTPAFAPKTWEHMQTLNTPKHDFSTGYAANVAAARYWAMLSETDPGKFDKTLARYREDFQRLGMNKIEYQWWTQYELKTPSAKACKDIDSVIAKGTWVKIPDQAAKTGFMLDDRNKDGIGWVNQDVLDRQVPEEKEHNSKHRERYKYSAPQIAGMLIFLGGHYQAVFAEMSVVNAKTKPLIATSLGRSLWSHNMLSEMGYPTTDKLPLHQYGEAVDITKNGMSEQQRQVFEFVLNDLRAAGYLSYSPEAAAWHIVPNSEMIPFFIEQYRNYTL